MRVVSVTAKRGDPSVARAGVGKAARTASCTSSPYHAALRAAAKFFGCPESHIVLAFTGDADRTVEFLAKAYDKPVKVLHLEFEDRGQDFLDWDVALEDGQILNSTPFQYTTWAKCQVVDPEKLAPGVHPVVIASGHRLRLNYAIAKMRLKGGAS